VPLGACGADADETSRSSDTATDLDAACAEIAAAVPRGDDVEIEVSNDSFPAFVGSGQRFGCVVQVAGRTTPEQPVPALVTTFAESLGPGWETDNALIADGPSETVYGLWRDEVLCLVRVRWGDRVPSAPPGSGAYEGTIGCEHLPARQVPQP